MDTMNTIFYIVILIISVAIHEIAHGYIAYKWGDMTAHNAGRLTLNPLVHLDIFGSIILPALLVLTKAGFVFGWAKPVPVNPAQFSNRKKGMISVAIVGIFMNFLIAVIFGIFIRTLVHFGVGNPNLLSIMGIVVYVNLFLGVFNLMPVPPLDGSRILFALLGDRFRTIEYKAEQYSIFFFLLFIFFVWGYIAPFMLSLFQLLTGLAG